MARTIKCRLCSARSPKGEFPERMAWLRRHRKRKHPTAHKKSVKKGLKTKRERGIINKKNPCPPKGKKPKGDGWKWNKKVKRWVRRKKKGRGFEFK